MAILSNFQVLDFQYAGSNTLPLNYTSMAETFYSKSLSSLSGWVRGLDSQLGPLKTGKIFQIFQMVSDSVTIFGHKMKMDKPVTLTNTQPSLAISPCQAGLILVKFANLTLPLNPSTTTWIKR